MNDEITNNPEDPTPRVTRRSFLGLVGMGTLGAATTRTRRLRATNATTPPSIAAAPTTTTAAPATLGSTTVEATTVARIPTTPGILVMVTLYGGNDGLNTLIPLDAAPYLTGRGALAYKASESIPLAEGLGLHPNLAGFKGLWDTKQLAIVRGVGYPNPSRSHFRSQDIWSSAVPATFERTGWLGRWYDSVSTDPLGMAAIASSVPRFLIGRKSSAVVVGGATASGGSSDFKMATRLLSQPDDSLGSLAARVRSTSADLGRVDTVFGPMLASQSSVSIQTATLEPGAVARAGNVLDDQLNVVARLIKGGAPTRAYAVSLGGFDTHANERANHARLMTILDQAVTGFLRVMAADPNGQGVTVVVYSEFGRRLAANGSAGTDHGTAAPMFVAGAKVKGGFYGDQPSLTDLDQGDLKFTTDFRSVYSTLLSGVLGADPLSALDKPYANLGFL